MMNKNFEAEYTEYKRLERLFEAAKKWKDKAAADAAREQYRILEEYLLTKGEAYLRTFELYKEAKERGNACIDLNDCIWDERVPGLVESLRSLGIERFTFSSTWSGAVRTAWLFKENGCELEGLVEINGYHDKFLSKDCEKVPAYLFKVN